MIQTNFSNLGNSLTAAVVSEGVQSLVYGDDFDFAAVASQSLGYAIGNSLFSTVDAKEQMLEHIEQQNGLGRAEAERIYQQNYAGGEDARFASNDGRPASLEDMLNGDMGGEGQPDVMTSDQWRAYKQRMAENGGVLPDQMYPNGAGIDGNPLAAYDENDVMSFAEYADTLVDPDSYEIMDVEQYKNMLTNTTVSLNQIQAIFPKAESSNIEKYLPALNKYLPEYGITTPERIAAFLGQVGVESDLFSDTTEDLYYKTEGQLSKNFSSKFECVSEIPYHKNEKKTAIYVYGDRSDLGNLGGEDGWNYRGSGLLQITGRDNFKRIGNNLGLDLVNNPDLVRTDPEVAVRTSLEYWKVNKLNIFADQGNIPALTKIINQKSLELSTRIVYTNNALNVLKK